MQTAQTNRALNQRNNREAYNPLLLSVVRTTSSCANHKSVLCSKKETQSISGYFQPAMQGSKQKFRRTDQTKKQKVLLAYMQTKCGVLQEINTGQFSHCETWLWQHHTMGTPVFRRDREVVRADVKTASDKCPRE